MPHWRHVESKSEATQSRWQWTWAIDDSVCHKDGESLGLVGHWWSGQYHRALSGIDGLLLVVVIGDGNVVIPSGQPQGRRLNDIVLAKAGLSSRPRHPVWFSRTRHDKPPGAQGVKAMLKPK